MTWALCRNTDYQTLNMSDILEVYFGMEELLQTQGQRM